jgi:hypothetical protein
MDSDQQLLYETRVRPRNAIIAAVAGVLLLIASIVTLGGPHTKVDELTLDLLIANKRFPLDLIAAIVNGLATIGICWTLVFLFGCARARNPGVKSYIRMIALVAGVLSSATGVIYAAVVAVKVHEFATTGAQTYQEANHLTSGAPLLALQLLGQLAALLLAVSFVLVSLQAMNQGLLTRFMGYLGMFAGALVLFQITQVPVVQAFWLFAVACLLLGRWPTGTPASWRTGKPEPWPSSAQARAQRGAAAAAPRGGARRERGRPAPAGAGAAGNGDGSAGLPGPASRSGGGPTKRKRKHRR